MKTLLVFLTTLILAVSISACAPKTTADGTKVKCPACGYEFDADAHRR